MNRGKETAQSSSMIKRATSEAVPFLSGRTNAFRQNTQHAALVHLMDLRNLKSEAPNIFLGSIYMY